MNVRYPLILLYMFGVGTIAASADDKSANPGFFDRFQESYYVISTDKGKLSEATSKAEAEKVAAGARKLFKSGRVTGPMTRVTPESIVKGINQTIDENVPKTHYEVISATGKVGAKHYKTKEEAEAAVGKGGRVRGPIYVYSDKAIFNPFVVPADRRPIFEAEGNEGGRFHTREPHVPGDSSGLTVGRGYDIGTKLSAKDRKKADAGNAEAKAKFDAAKAGVKATLTAAGLSEAQAEAYAGAVGLYGADAQAYLDAHRAELDSITPMQQLALFNAIYPQYVDRAKSSVETAYGVKWDDLNPVIRNSLVDLSYRGDLGLDIGKDGKGPQHLKDAIVSNDTDKYYKAMTDEKFWFPNGGTQGKWSLPRNRFDIRNGYLKNALGK